MVPGFFLSKALSPISRVLCVSKLPQPGLDLAHAKVQEPALTLVINEESLPSSLQGRPQR